MENHDQIAYEKRLRWACRRGMLELDTLFGRFFDRHYSKLSVQHKKDFEALLTCPDDQLFKWFFGGQTVDLPEFLPIIKLIQESKVI